MSDPPPTPPGWPGIEPRWTSSAKNGIGTAVQRASRVWFTLSHGILNEVYYPRLDQACLRDLGLIVTDGQSFFSEEKRDAASETRWLAPAADHAPIDQQAILLKPGQNNPAARAFLAFLKSPPAIAIIKKYGYETP